MIDCRLCSSASLSVNANDFWNRPLLQSANFHVLPSLGALVEGWLLIVPKDHVISMGALDGTLIAEMQDIKLQVSSIVQSRYGSVCLFEHGPAAANRAVGCSVDHAHLHVVPLGFDLAIAAQPLMPTDAIWHVGSYESCRHAFMSHQDYLYIEQPIGRGKIATSAAFTSQTLRRAIAETLDVSDEYNWRDYPRLDMVQRTADYFVRAA
jgi:ATP adenylyltransferase